LSFPEKGNDARGLRATVITERRRHAHQVPPSFARWVAGAVRCEPKSLDRDTRRAWRTTGLLDISKTDMAEVGSRRNNRKTGEGIVGLIRSEEYVCDYCGSAVSSPEMLIGKLALRKRGARGLSREISLSLHPDCLEKLTENAERPGRRRARGPAADSS
jgi:hypothetical protein